MIRRRKKAGKSRPPKRAGLGAPFWTMIAFGMACIVAGYVLATYGPRWFPASPPADAPPAAPVGPLG